jgi:D-arabinose 1-dehydrogenase-like Zn-dependent alcohol dehydrogenase
MHAMVLKKLGAALEWTELADRSPGPGEIRVKVGACGVCRTDLHVVDGELPNPKLPIIPGHEIVGRIDAIGEGVEGLRLGERVGIPWLGRTCGTCSYCADGRENLCNRPLFTGYTRDGGFATAAIADARYAFPLGEADNDVAVAPLLCAGLIGWRSLVIAGKGKKLGLYGFGAAAHIVAQVARWQGRSPGTKRWVIRRKAEVIAAVRGGLLSIEEACTTTNTDCCAGRFPRRWPKAYSPSSTSRTISPTWSPRRSAPDSSRRGPRDHGRFRRAPCSAVILWARVVAAE